MKCVFNHSTEPEYNLGTAMNIEKDTLYIYDYIVKDGSNGDPTNVSSEEFLDNLKSMTGDMFLRVNSKGGELGYSLSIYNALREHDGLVTSIIDGYAYSCAAWVPLAADVRLINSGGIVMVHNPIINTTINSEDAFDKVMPQWKASRNSIAEIIIERTGLDPISVSNMMNAQTFMNSKQAIETKFCTGMRETKASLPRGVRNSLPTEIQEAIPEVVNTDYSDLLSKSMLYRSKKLINR